MVARGNVFTWADITIADEQYVVAMPSDVRTDVTAIIGCAVMTGAGAVYHTAGGVPRPHLPLARAPRSSKC